MESTINSGRETKLLYKHHYITCTEMDPHNNSSVLSIIIHYYSSVFIVEQVDKLLRNIVYNIGNACILKILFTCDLKLTQ